MGKYKIVGIIALLMLMLVSCGHEETLDYQGTSEHEETLNHQDTIEDEETLNYQGAGEYEVTLDTEPLLTDRDTDLDIEYECVLLVEGAEEEVSIYDLCWVEVRHSPEGREVIALYESVFGRFPRDLIARDLTFGALKEAVELVVVPYEYVTINRFDAQGNPISEERPRYDRVAFAEATGIQQLDWWVRSERFRNISEEFASAFGYDFDVVRGDHEAVIRHITIDELEELVRRSVEEGIDHVTDAIGPLTDYCPDRN